MRSAGEVFTRSQILEHVWGYDFDPSTNVVDVCVKRIRAKIEDLCDKDGTEKSVVSHVDIQGRAGFEIHAKVVQTQCVSPADVAGLRPFHTHHHF